MATEDKRNAGERAAHELTQEESSLLAPSDEVGEAEFLAAFGESLAQTLDLDTWDRGENLGQKFEILDREVAEALEQEDQIRKKVREIVFPQILARPNAPK